ncbi:MAG: hypothetical protein AAF748_05615 [Pseudomonadota bacterium]
MDYANESKAQIITGTLFTTCRHRDVYNKPIRSELAVENSAEENIHCGEDICKIFLDQINAINQSLCEDRLIKIRIYECLIDIQRFISTIRIEESANILHGLPGGADLEQVEDLIRDLRLSLAEFFASRIELRR